MDKLEYCFCTSINIAHLQSEWTQLHRQAQASFFLSWQWVSTWLETFKPEALLLRVTQGEKLVGLGLFSSRQFKKFKFLPCQKVCLLQMGDEQQDQIWIEHNAVLCAPSFRNQIHSELADQFIQSNIAWDVLVFSGVQQDIYEKLEQNKNTFARELWRAPTYSVDLKGVKKKHPSYIASLSRNTRYQINRAIKGWKTHGELKLESAKEWPQCEEFYNFAAQQHQKKWGEKQSGFYNPYFCQFHQALIKNSWPSQCIDLLALTLNGQPIAVLYNFVMYKTVYFYLSGIDYNHDSKLKPGLVIHALAIQNYMDLGYDSYDFLGGAAQYKQSLGAATEDIAGIEIMRKTTVSLLESRARSIKANFSQRFKKPKHTQRVPSE